MNLEDKDFDRYEFNRIKQNNNVKNEKNEKNENNKILYLPYLYLNQSLKKIIKNESKNLVLLDYCCGTGMHSEFALKHGIECWGIDISEASILEAKKMVSRYNVKFENIFSVTQFLYTHFFPIFAC